MHGSPLSSRLLLLLVAAPLTFAIVGCPTLDDSLSLLPTPAPHARIAPPPPDTPIKVGGGAMTFHSKSAWIPVPSARNPTFCTTLRSQPVYDLEFEDPTREETAVSTDWTVVIKNYSLDKAHENRPGSGPGHEGVKMTATASGTCGTQSGVETITISTFHEKNLKKGRTVGFYPNDGAGLPEYSFRKRYHNTAAHDEYDCTNDPDSCESLAWISINGAPFHECSTKGCMLSVFEP